MIQGFTSTFHQLLDEPHIGDHSGSWVNRPAKRDLCTIRVPMNAPRSFRRNLADQRMCGIEPEIFRDFVQGSHRSLASRKPLGRRTKLTRWVASN